MTDNLLDSLLRGRDHPEADELLRQLKLEVRRAYEAKISVKPADEDSEVIDGDS